MLEISTIKNGLVIDHIKAGYGIKIFNKLGLEKSNLNVALIMNVKSDDMGKKDIIKIEGADDIDYRVLTMISNGITINEIRNEKIINKIKPELPDRVEGILSCNNRNCITNVEMYVPHTFSLVDREKATYRCEYCDNIMTI